MDPRIGIVTFRRPKFLESGLRSALPLRELRGVVVLDDDPTDSGSEGVVAGLNAEAGAGISYLGHAGKQAMVALLEPFLRREGVDPHLARFALLGAPEFQDLPLKANRNALFLLAAGGRAVGLDEDVVSEVVPGARGPLRLHSTGDPTWSRPYPDRERLLQAHPLIPGDPVSILVAPLGRPPREDVLEDEGSPLLRRRWEAGAVRVAVSMLPVWGHTGARYPHYRLLLPREDEPWQEDREVYEAVRTAPWEYRPPRLDTLTDSGFLQQAAAGYDLTLPLPPVFPHLPRNQDGVQGSLVPMSRPGDVLWVGNTAVRHEGPLDRLSRGDDIWRRPVYWGMAEVVLLLLSQLHFPGDLAAEERVGRLAGVLAEAGDEPLDAFLQRLAPLRKGYLEVRLRSLDAVYEEHGGHPRWWGEDVERSMDIVEGLLDDPIPPIPDDVPRGWSDVQGLLGRYGRLLAAWPTVLEVAARHSPELAAIPRVPG